MRKWILQFFSKRPSFWKGVNEATKVRFELFFSFFSWYYTYPLTPTNADRVDPTKEKNRKKNSGSSGPGSLASTPNDWGGLEGKNSSTGEKSGENKTNMALYFTRVYTQNPELNTSAVLQKCLRRKKKKKRSEARKKKRKFIFLLSNLIRFN